MLCISSRLFLVALLLQIVALSVVLGYTLGKRHASTFTRVIVDCDQCQCRLQGEGRI